MTILKIATITGLLILNGCSTIKTVAPKNGKVVIQNGGTDSTCNTIPRIYSGTAYCACRSFTKRDLNPASENRYISIGSSEVFFTLVADTLVLPYTIVSQITKGNIEVNSVPNSPIH